MLRQLDILALEPFYGGARRHMLETLMRCSRHRWTLLKLPPRRLERRLACAAHWFGEQLTRHWVGRMDVLFTSEALNLADLYRLMPQLARNPAVVYFHEHQLPDPASCPALDSVDLANLTSANVATEIWFNSRYHQRAFLAELNRLVEVNPELSARQPISQLGPKMHHLLPPVEMPSAPAAPPPPDKDGPALFVDVCDADVDLLRAALQKLADKGEHLRLLLVTRSGERPSHGKLSELFPVQLVPDSDSASQCTAMAAATAYASLRPAAFDEHAIRALHLSRRVVLPRSGFYPELLPRSMHRWSLYEPTPAALADLLLDALYLPAEQWDDADQLQQTLHLYDTLAACRAIDERLDTLAHPRAVHPHTIPPPPGIKVR